MTTIKRLTKLAQLLNRYANSENAQGEHSERFYGWANEFNEIKENNPEVFKKYCELNEYSLEHDATDCMA